MSEIQEQIHRELLNTTGGFGWHTNGYHSFEMEGVNIIGQRRPKLRLDLMKQHYDFTDKTVIDFGCNVGGMLFHLPELKHGYGYDKEIRYINAARNIQKILHRDNLTFDLLDTDKNDFSKITVKPDLIFLLSLGSWMNWQLLYSYCAELSVSIILEINNEDEGIPQLSFFNKKGYNCKLIIPNSLDDTTGNNKRRTYLCYND
jgi:SAM-dependent methyltransferase